FNTTSGARSRGGTIEDEDDEDDEDAGTIIASTPGVSRMRMVPQTGRNASTAVGAINRTPTGEVYTSARDSEFKAKYGQPGSGGWDALQVSPRQSLWLKYAFTFCTAFMAASLSYLLLAQLPFLAGSSPLSSKPWFIG